MFLDNILQLDIYLVLPNGKIEYNHDPYFPKEYIKGDNLYYTLNVNCSNYARYKDLKEIKIMTNEGDYFKFSNIIDFSELNSYVTFVFKRINKK